MSKMNQRFTDEYGSGFTKSIEDFCDDDYLYKKWLLEIQPKSGTTLTMEDLDEWKTIPDDKWDYYSGLPNPNYYESK
jgi:hypothetical protein|tara:strand:- start:1163 stop:1393 length:231 start_codon:yes stop_codon:yes gene_type:complete